MNFPDIFLQVVSQTTTVFALGLRLTSLCVIIEVLAEFLHFVEAAVFATAGSADNYHRTEDSHLTGRAMTLSLQMTVPPPDVKNDGF